MRLWFALEAWTRLNPHSGTSPRVEVPQVRWEETEEEQVERYLGQDSG